MPLNPAPLQIVAALVLRTPMSWGATWAQGVGLGVGGGVGRGVGSGAGRGVGVAVRRGVGLGVGSGADGAAPPGAAGVPLALGATAVAANDADACDSTGPSTTPAAGDGSGDCPGPEGAPAPDIPVAPATSPAGRSWLPRLSARTDSVTRTTRRAPAAIGERRSLSQRSRVRSPCRTTAASAATGPSAPLAIEAPQPGHAPPVLPQHLSHAWTPQDGHVFSPILRRVAAGPIRLPHRSQ
jgi:hypothetical protein